MQLSILKTISSNEYKNVLKSPEATIVKKAQNDTNVAIRKLVNYKTSAAIMKAVMK